MFGACMFTTIISSWCNFPWSLLTDSLFWMDLKHIMSNSRTVAVTCLLIVLFELPSSIFSHWDCIWFCEWDVCCRQQNERFCLLIQPANMFFWCRKWCHKYTINIEIWVLIYNILLILWVLGFNTFLWWLSKHNHFFLL